MAKKEISGLLMLDEISTDGGSTWKTIVCLSSSSITGSSASTEKKTRCGVFTTTSNNATTATGSGVAVADAESNEVTYQELQILRDAMTVIKYRRQNAADVAQGITAGEITYSLFDARVTEVTETSNEEGAIEFTWTITSTGTVDWENSGS